MEHETCDILCNMTRFHDDLKSKMDEYVHFVYDCTKKFPREELYGVTSQLRRAALSVVLNKLPLPSRKRKRRKNRAESSSQKCWLVSKREKQNAFSHGILIAWRETLLMEERLFISWTPASSRRSSFQASGLSRPHRESSCFKLPLVTATDLSK